VKVLKGKVEDERDVEKIPEIENNEDES